MYNTNKYLPRQHSMVPFQMTLLDQNLNFKVMLYGVQLYRDSCASVMRFKVAEMTSIQTILFDRSERPDVETL